MCHNPGGHWNPVRGPHPRNTSSFMVDFPASYVSLPEDVRDQKLEPYSGWKIPRPPWSSSLSRGRIGKQHNYLDVPLEVLVKG